MSRQPLKAIATLVRWRKFEESLASDEFRRSHVQAQRSAEQADGANGKVGDVRQRLSEMLAAPQLDLERIRLAAQIEEDAWRRLQMAEAELAEARQQRDIAQARHVETRARTRVSQARQQKKKAACDERIEKILFDRMADIYLAGRKRHD